MTIEERIEAKARDIDSRVTVHVHVSETYDGRDRTIDGATIDHKELCAELRSLVRDVLEELEHRLDRRADWRSVVEDMGDNSDRVSTADYAAGVEWAQAQMRELMPKEKP